MSSTSNQAVKRPGNASDSSRPDVDMSGLTPIRPGRLMCVLRSIRFWRGLWPAACSVPWRGRLGRGAPGMWPPAQPAAALERLAEDAHGDLVYTFSKPWSDGTTGSTLSPLELLEKLAALVPLPRVHLVRYGGCLAPHSSLRGAVTPTPRQQGVDGHA